ncbi:MAG TPA: HRDC domain-containing protein, partial [Solirubrobacteraceae bacterium]|nr:HRDC domain-containing protein [Solirubrobacteraceae bacterium]
MSGEDRDRSSKPLGRPLSLAELLAGARVGGRLAVDTEFMGEGRYRTLLCLVQLAVPADAVDGEPTLVVDPLAEDFDGGELASLLADPAIEIVVHAGRQDIALLRRRLATEVTNVFDTQLSAGFAGLGAQSSYDSLLSDVLGLRVAKSASFTRWDARPLSREQMDYAREDVVHLLELADAIEDRLGELGRIDWAREECAPLAASSDERDPETIFGRLPRVNQLNPSARPVARELVRWRERTAERQDRPVQSVLGDATLIEIAKRKPASRGELERIRGAGPVAQGRRADEVIELIDSARKLPPETTEPGPPRTPPKPDDAPIVALAEALIRSRAREAGLAYELLAAKADLQAIVATSRAGAPEPDVRTLRGWRRELVGEELLSLLDGKLSLSVETEGRRKTL